MHNDMNTNEIEQLLKNAPKIEDKRSKEEVFARLHKEGLFDDAIVKQSAKITKKHTFPYYKISLVAAILVVAIVAPIIFTKVNESEQVSFDDSGNVNEEKISLESDSIADVTSIEEAEAGNFNITSNLMRMMDLRRGLYADELVDEIVFEVVGVSNENEYIPLSLKISQTFLMENKLTSTSAYEDIYSIVYPLLNAEELGFKEIKPKDSKEIASVNTSYQTIYVLGKPYLQPTNETYENAVEALYSWSKESKFLSQYDINLKIEDQGDLINIKFNEPLNTTIYDELQVINMLEEIISTAASFNKQVRFENIVQLEFGGFFLSDVVPTLIGINEIFLQ